ncbi:MAG: REP-associated tyrosine transposase [Thermoanaerobaculia bacterium]
MIGNDTHAYRRKLPHLSKPGKTYFVTFVTLHRWILPPHAREIALRSCTHGHPARFWLHCCTVMPDHVHLLVTPCEHTSIQRIIADIKSASAHVINRVLHRKGHVWQEESFDHILRSDEQVIEKAEYILNNPVRKGLAALPRDWPWSWVASV